jgi:hypothetical protein
VLVTVAPPEICARTVPAMVLVLTAAARAPESPVPLPAVLMLNAADALVAVITLVATALTSTPPVPAATVAPSIRAVTVSVVEFTDTAPEPEIATDTPEPPELPMVALTLTATVSTVMVLVEVALTSTVDPVTAVSAPVISAVAVPPTLLVANATARATDPPAEIPPASEPAPDRASIAPLAIAVTLTDPSHRPDAVFRPAQTCALPSMLARIRLAMLFRLMPPATEIATDVALPLGTFTLSATPTVIVEMLAVPSAVTVTAPVATAPAPLIVAVTVFPLVPPPI